MEKEKIDSDSFASGALFAASNSSCGFKSYYKEIFDRTKFKRFYIIKGGPGTGKSSFMRSVGKHFEDMKIGVEFYYCSSDADSIDGVIIDGKIAIVDGTAPHIEDVELSGARDEIINFGEFWDVSKLECRLCEIEDLSREKSECYKKAYKYLASCGNLADIGEELIAPFLQIEKMQKAIERILDEMPLSDSEGMRIGLSDSVGMKGKVHFETYEKSAEKLYYIDDYFSTAHFFLSALILFAKRDRYKIQVSYNPIIPKHPNCVYFCNSKTAFVISQEKSCEFPCKKRINMKRFVRLSNCKEVKDEFRHCQRLYDSMLSSAIESLRGAGEYHFALEKIYSSSMNFSSLAEYTQNFCKMLCDNYFS